MRDDGYRDFVLDQLRDLGGVASRSMFGGYGLYSEGVFFGAVFRGQLYFKTDASTRAAYVERGMPAFRPNARQTLTSYYEVPPDVIEDAAELVAWARRAVAVALAAGRP